MSDNVKKWLWDKVDSYAMVVVWTAIWIGLALSIIDRSNF